MDTPYYNGYGSFNNGHTNGIAPSRVLGPDGLPYRSDAPDAGFAVPSVIMHGALTSSGFRSYLHGGYDEALRHSREDALAMRNDAFLMALLQERKLATASLRFRIEVDDERDPIQKAVQDGLLRIIRRIPKFRRMVMYLLEAIWYGRYGSQMQWGWDVMKVPSLRNPKQDEERKCLTIRKHEPVNGDKVGHHWDGTPYLTINAAYASSIPNAELTPTTSGGMGLYLRGSWRWRYCIHTHEAVDTDFWDSTGSDAIHGVGIRSVLFWLDWLRKEWLSNVADWCERTGLGVRLWYFQGGNTKSKDAVEKAARESNDRTNILVPRFGTGGAAAEGVDFVDTTSSGADLLLRLQEHIEEIQERYVIGQSMSGGNGQGDGLGGEGKAKLSKDTKDQIRNYDAGNLGETLTTDVLRLIQWWTYKEPEARAVNARFSFNIDEPEPEKLLNAVKTFVLDLGGKVRTNELQAVIGLSAPQEGDEVISIESIEKQKQAAQPQQPMPGMPGQPGMPGDEGGAVPPGASPPEAGAPPGGPPMPGAGPQGQAAQPMPKAKPPGADDVQAKGGQASPQPQPEPKAGAGDVQPKPQPEQQPEPDVEGELEDLDAKGEGAIGAIGDRHYQYLGRWAKLITRPFRYAKRDVTSDNHYHELADYYADLWNAGDDPDDEEMGAVEDELEGSDWTVVQNDETGEWEAVQVDEGGVTRFDRDGRPLRYEWVSFTGKRGGKGWRNSDNPKDVRYQEKQPGGERKKSVVKSDAGGKAKATKTPKVSKPKKEKVAKPANTSGLSDADRQSAKRSLASLKRHHGENVGKRLTAISDQLKAALSRAPDGDRAELERQIAKVEWQKSEVGGKTDGIIEPKVEVKHDDDKLEGTGSSESGGRLPPEQQLGADATAASDAVLPGAGDEPGGRPGSVPTGEDGGGRGLPGGVDSIGSGSVGSPDVDDGTAVADTGRGGPAGGVGSGSGEGGRVGRPGEAAAERAEAVTAEEPTEENPTDSRGDNFRYTSEDFAKGGLKAKFKANIEAIKTLKTIQMEGRDTATPEEQAVMSKFVGWGQFPQLFGYRYDKEWEKEKKILAEVLSESELKTAGESGSEDEITDAKEGEEYKSARSSTKNAHYTHPDIVKAHWEMAKRLGFKGGKFLETSAGVGYYLGLMPPDLAGKTMSSAVELDHLTGQMLKMLYPRANVNVMGFQDYPAPDNFYDLVASNVPFGNYQVHDPSGRYNKHLAKVHDYFFLKSADITRPGGLVMHITSTGTMDKPRNASIRDELAKTCDFVAAIRFPGQAHKENAGTDVVTDMVILRKRPAGEKPVTDETPEEAKAKEPGFTGITTDSLGRIYHWVDGKRVPGPNWLDTEMVKDPAGGDDIPVNKYFADHPEQILGTLDRTGTMRTGKEKNVSKTADYDERLAAAIERLPKDLMKPAAISKEAFKPDVMPAPGDVRVGGYTIKGGKVYRREGGALVEQNYNAKDKKRLEGLLGVRDAQRAVINDQLRGDDATASRKALNDVYDAFVAAHGFIGDKANQAVFHDDPDSFGLLALEKYDKKAKKGVKADIFRKDTVRSNIRAESAANTSEALGISLHESGGIDVERMAGLTGRKVSDIEKDLRASGLAFLDPSLGWKPADQYLSGNVRQKLVLANAAAAADPKFKPNVEALEKVQPRDLSTDEIKVKMGAPWVPASDVQEFAASLLKGNPEGFKADYLPTTGQWMADFTGRQGLWMEKSQLARDTWATEDVKFKKLFEAALNNTPVVVYYPKTDPDEKAVVNSQATSDAKAKIQEMRERFSEWVWEDDARKERLSRFYNDNFNNIVPMKYDGQFQTFPGINPNEDIRPHIKDFVWQVVSTGKGLAAHEVGCGKTRAMVISAMELRRLGLAKKPCIACMKANVEAIAEEAQRLYPAAKILSTADVFDAKSRKQTIASIATGDYDMIIMTHDNLNMLQMKPETVRAYIQDEIKDLEAAKLAAHAEDPSADNRVVKALETAKENLQAKLAKALSNDKKDDAVYFEETGIDQVFIDEAHIYKSLPVYTKQTNLKGVPTTRSDRATAMQMRTRWLMEQHGGRGVVFATGTPITNTMAELYNMQRYLQPNELHERGLEAFDAWANVFGETETNMEFTPTGEYKPISRFSSFTNLGELQAMIRQTMDVQRADDLKKPDGSAVVVRPKRKDVDVLAPRTPTIERLMSSLVDRAKSLDPRDRKKDNMLSIATDGRKGSLDMRLLDASAPDDPNSKVNKCVAKVLDIAKARPGVTQMIFSDLGVNPTQSRASLSADAIKDMTDMSDIAPGVGGFHLYKDIIDKLVAGGIPRDQIADFSKLDDAKKEAAQEAMRQGKIRVAIGSTAKMGTGVNVQDKLAAMHTLDVPYLPAAVEQRDGRGWRSGNLNDPTKPADQQEVGVYRYLTEGSLDQWNWEIIARKTKFIRQVISNKDVGARDLKEEDSETITPERLAAIASGDTRYMEKVNVDEEVKQLRMAEKRHTKEQLRLKESVHKMEHSEFDGIPAWTKLADQYGAAVKHLDANPLAEGEFKVKIGDEEFTDRKAAKEAFDKVDEQARGEWRDTKIGEFRGFGLYRVSQGAGGSSAHYLLGPDGFKIGIGMSGPASAEYATRNMAKKHQESVDMLKSVQTNLEATRKGLGKEFAKAEVLKEKVARAKQLEAELAKKDKVDEPEFEHQSGEVHPEGSGLPSWMKDDAPKVPKALKAVPPLPKKDEDVIEFGKALPEDMVEFAIDSKSGKKAARGFEIGPMAVVSTGTPRKPEWTVYHRATGLRAFSTTDRNLAKAGAHIMQAKGNWDFQDAKGMDADTQKHGGMVSRAAAANNLAALSQLAKAADETNEKSLYSRPYTELVRYLRERAEARLDYAKHRFATTQFNLTGEARAKVLALADTIRDEDLAEDGIEHQPHVTILFGLHGSADASTVQSLVRDFGPVTATLGEVSIFAAHDADPQRGGAEFDVVKVEVMGERLVKLHKLLETLEHTSTHPVYNAHSTLAYVKPGEGQKYVGKRDVDGLECHFTSFVYSDPDGAETVISLVPN